MWLQFLTGSRVLVGAAAAILLTTWYPERWAIWVALGSVGLIELTDLLDGYLARRLGMASKFGAMFDPYADAVSRFLVYWGLSQAGYCAPYVVPVIAVRDITVAYLRTWLSVRGGRINARWSGKLKAAVLGAGALILTAGPLYREDWQGTVNEGVSVIVAVAVAASLVDYLAAAARVHTS